MAQVISKLTVLFEEPFWIGVYERNTNDEYEACKVTFGAEPKDYEVYDFFLSNYAKLKFGRLKEEEAIAQKRVNPKKMQRDIKKQIQNTGIGTKAQQALKLLQEQGKLVRKTISREQKEEEKERQFLLRQEKRKEKHRGH